MHNKPTNEKIILGLSNAHHDGSACIVKGGKILAAIECERLNKIKKSRLDYSNLKETIDYVLKSVGMGVNDIDYIAVGSCPEKFLGNPSFLLHKTYLQISDLLNPALLLSTTL